MVKRPNTITIRLADDELEQLRLAAERDNRTVSDYARLRLVGPVFASADRAETHSHAERVVLDDGEVETARDLARLRREFRPDPKPAKR